MRGDKDSDGAGKGKEKTEIGRKESWWEKYLREKKCIGVASE